VLRNCTGKARGTPGSGGNALLEICEISAPILDTPLGGVLKYLARGQRWELLASTNSKTSATEETPISLPLAGWCSRRVSVVGVSFFAPVWRRFLGQAFLQSILKRT
jgi:hypothetical protein